MKASKNSLFNYQNNGVSVCLILRPRTKDEEVSPVYWRIIYRRKQKHYFTGLSFRADEWMDFANRNLMKYRDTKISLEKYFDDVLKKNISALISDGEFSWEALNNRLGRGDTNNISSVLEAKIELLRDENRIKYAKVHEGTLRALQRYVHYSKLKKAEKAAFVQRIIENKYVAVGDDKIQIPEYDIPFDDITPSFLRAWDAFLRETGAGDSTIGIYMRTLRSTINRNDEAGEPYLTGAKYPFGAKKGKYNIPVGGRKDIAIPIEDIWRIEDFQTDDPKLEYARDMFLALLLSSGLNFGDLARLKYSDINKITGELEIKRKKTNRANSNSAPIVYIPLIAPLVKIINKYGNGEGYIFPILSGVRGERNITAKIAEELENKVNKPLKTIAAMLDIRGDLSSGVARNSYMTYLQTELMYSDSVVKQMVGHKIKDVTAGYVNLNPKKRLEINSKLINPERTYHTVKIGVI